VVTTAFTAPLPSGRTNRNDWWSDWDPFGTGCRTREAPVADRGVWSERTERFLVTYEWPIVDQVGTR
jgi:hypothetical protein